MKTFDSSPAPLDLRALLDEEFLRTSFKINCVQVGRIVSYDADTQLAVVELGIKRILNGETVTAALLKDVPVFIYGGGAGRMTMPIAPKDPCLVLFNDRDMDNWHYSGQTTPPGSLRAHSLSDGIALVGIRPRSDLYGEMNRESAEIKAPGISLKGNVNISTGATGTFSSGDGKVITVANGVIINIV